MGKWVARAGATGGGRTYRGQKPVNWYAALVVIVLLGVASVAFARYEYRAGPATNTTAPLKTGKPWFAAAVFDICGTQKVLPANIGNPKTQSFYTSGTGVITIAPKSTAVAGANATFGKFISSYKGLTVSSTQIVLPATAHGITKSTTTTSTTPKKKSAAKTKTYRNGATCEKGTKYAGKKANVQIRYWPSAFASKKKPVNYTGDPATLRFTDDQLITVAFVPAGTKVPKPGGSVVTALLDTAAGASSPSTGTKAPSTIVPPTTTTSTTTGSAATATATASTTPATGSAATATATASTTPATGSAATATATASTTPSTTKSTTKSTTTSG